METSDLKNLVGIVDIKDTTDLRTIENFVPVYDYSKHGIKPTSAWEYGALKFGDIYLRLFATSRHAHFIKEMDEAIAPNRDKLEDILRDMAEALRTAKTYKTNHPLCAEICNLIMGISMGAP